MRHSNSDLIGILIFVAGLVITLIGYSIADHISKMGFAVAGLTRTVYKGI